MEWKINWNIFARFYIGYRQRLRFLWGWCIAVQLFCIDRKRYVFTGHTNDSRKMRMSKKKEANSNIRRSFSPNVLRQCSRKPFLRSLYVVLTTYVQMSYVALSSYGQSTYTKNTRLKCEKHLGHALYSGQSAENLRQTFVKASVLVRV